MFVVWNSLYIFVLLKGKRRKKEKKNSRKVLRSEKFSVPLRHQSFTNKKHPQT